VAVGRLCINVVYHGMSVDRCLGAVKCVDGNDMVASWFGVDPLYRVPGWWGGGGEECLLCFFGFAVD
jgi:hypothetical protein